MRVRYYGHIGQTTGFAKAAVATCHALLTIPGLELEIRVLGAVSIDELTEDALPLARCIRGDADLTPNPDVVIVHTLPVDCGRVLELAHLVAYHQAGAPVVAFTRLSNAVLIAYTTWEAAPLPADVNVSLGAFDQVWWPSFIASALSSGDARHRIVPHAFDPTTLDHRQSRLHREDGRYRFYYVGAFNARKNVNGLIRAYANAFAPSENVELVIRSHGTATEKIIAACAETGIPGPQLPKLLINNQYASDVDIIDLHRTADCYVTASRGEAWNLPAFDAMLANRSVITPDGQGSDDFLLHHPGWTWYSSVTVPAYVDVTVERGAQQPGGGFAVQVVGAQGLTSKARWQEPDLGELAHKMRLRYERRATYTHEWDKDTRVRVIEAFGYEAVGQRISRNMATARAARDNQDQEGTPT